MDSLLWQVDYYDFYGNLQTSVPPKVAEKIFLVHKTGDRADSNTAKALIQEFVGVAKLKGGEAQALYDALVECMTNVLEHAYPRSEMREGFLPNRWWLLGTLTPSTHEISFCFYDQGVGIA